MFGYDTKSFGDELIAVAGLSDEQVAHAREVWRETGGEFGWVIASLGYVSRPQLYTALAEASGLPLSGDPERLRQHMDPRLVVKMTYELVIEHQFMPFQLQEGVLVILTAHPGRAATYDLCRERFGIEEIAELLVTDLDLTMIAARTFRDDMVDMAVLSNHRRNPEQSASRVFTNQQIVFVAGIILAFLVWMYLDVRWSLTFVIAVLQVFFLTSVVFKTVLMLAGARHEIEPPVDAQDVAALHDTELPIYSVLVPVYREPEVVGNLIAGLKKIDYPQHKLDIMLLLEEDDVVTLDAAKAARPSANWRFIIVPNAQPRTKPKACNYGLFFARGEFLTIYDAEDIPDPTQLKSAVVAFRRAGPSFVCFQAALNYFNAAENVLTRLFTLEYSYWFDYILPGLDRLHLPIPLGGTSNHFDVSKLRSLGGWDPFNTTEDADLGIRASAEGYRIGILNSTTFEEANADFGNWIRQRSRWIKGYMQTWLVYTRHPVSLIRTIGLRKFLAFNFFVGGTALTALAAPPLWAIFLLWLFTRTRLVEPLFPDVVLYVAIVNLLVGNFLGVYLSMIAVFRRGTFPLLPYALLNPLYWLMQSIAAYKALGQLFTKPFYWEKTQHGISRLAPFRRKSEAVRSV
jgi:cellulose synthase/poly-beta-1,6-N-acetylglucosamine synthase-like glycosyltransferase